MARIAPPPQGARVTYRGGSWTVEGSPRPGNCVTLRSDAVSAPRFLGQAGDPRQTMTTIANVAELAVVWTPPVAPDPLATGSLRLVDDHGEDLHHLRAGVQVRAHVAGLGRRDLPTLVVFGLPGGAVEVVETRAGCDGAHESGTIQLEPDPAWGRSWLLRPHYGGTDGVVIEATAPGLVTPVAVPFVIEGIEKPAIVATPSGPIAVGNTVAFDFAAPPVGHGTTGAIAARWLVGLPGATPEWRAYTPGDPVVPRAAGALRVHVALSGALADGSPTAAFVDLVVEARP